jgi:leucyl aminopeptidase
MTNTDKTVKVILIQSKNDLENDLYNIKNLQSLYNFKGLIGEYIFDQNSNNLYVGTLENLEDKNPNLLISCNPFEKQIDYYKLGLKIKEQIPKSISSIIIDNTNIENKISEQLYLGISQSYYKYTKKIKRVENENNNATVVTFLKKDEELEIRVKAINDGVTFSRDLSNQRGDELNPSTYPQIIKDKFQNYANSKVTILSKEEIDKLNMNMLSGVGRASQHGYCIITVEILPTDEIKETISIVGKGLTFDMGGMNIKENGYSLGMHIDMGGSAIGFGSALSLAQLSSYYQNKHTRYVFTSGIVENSLNEKALHAGDVIENIVGQSAIVTNTDAEGRLTLADVVPYTIINYKPDYIITLATLTGHAMVAFTENIAPIFSNDLLLRQKIYNSFLKQHEQVVEVDLPKDVFNAITDKSGIADFTNLYNYKSPQGGSQAAAAFVMSSAQPKLWKKNYQSHPDSYKIAHIDVAGPTMNKNNLATGYGVRGLVSVLLSN